MLGGCSAKQSINPNLRGISFEAEISYYNEKYVCDATIDSEGVLVMEFKYPEELSQLKISFLNGNPNIEYMGLTYSPNSNSMPPSSIAQVMYNVISTVESQGSAVVKDGENCLVDGRFGNTYFKLYLTPNGLPLSILIPDDSFKIQFNNLSLL